MSEKRGKNAEVNEPCNWYTENLPAVTMVSDLMSGTRAVRNGGYLIQWPNEDASELSGRTVEADLLNIYRKAVKGLTGKVFSKPIVVEDYAEDIASAILDDFDGHGHSIDTYYRKFFEEALAKGKAHDLVEMPRPELDESGQPVRLDAVAEREAGRRPYCVTYTWEDCIGWRVGEDGELSQVRLRETTEEADPENPWGTVEVVRVRVLSPGGWQLWSKDDSGNWAMEEEGETSLDDEIPLGTYYTNELGLLRATPYLEDLAHKNITHYRSASDQRQNLHVIRVSLWAVSGVQSDDDGALQGSGPGVMLRLTNPSGKVQLVETNGKPAELGFRDLENLTEEMELMALEPLLKKETQQTATEVESDRREATSPLQDMAAALERHINSQLRMMERMARLPENSLGTAVVNKSFALEAADVKNLDTLAKLQERGGLSLETLWKEMVRARALSEEFDPEEEMERLLTEDVSAAFEEPVEEVEE